MLLSSILWFQVQIWYIMLLKRSSLAQSSCVEDKLMTASTISLTVEFNGTNHVLLQDYGIFPKHQQFLKFTVQGPKDLHLKLLSSRSSVRKPIYYIIIAGWNNKRSVLGRSEILARDVVNLYKKPGLLDINQEKKFWISWENGKVLVGTGNILNKDIIIRWKEPSPFAVQNIEISTMHEASLNLKFLLDDLTVQCPKKSLVEWKLKKKSNCPTFNILNILEENSEVECACRCISYLECGGFDFNKKACTCTLFSDIVRNNSKSTIFKLV